MAKINSINNSTGALTVDIASGDPAVQFSINTVAKFKIGVDDDDSDKFKISSGSALGANDFFIITAAGECTLPLTPSFGAQNSANDLNVTGDSTTYTIIADTEIWDNGSDYNNANGVFTAPVTAKYLLCGNVYLDGLAAGHTTVEFKINGSNRNILGNGYTSLTSGVQAPTCTNIVSGILDMDASDVASLEIKVSGSTKVVDVYGSATNFATSFSGFLLS